MPKNIELTESETAELLSFFGEFIDEIQCLGDSYDSMPEGA